MAALSTIALVGGLSLAAAGTATSVAGAQSASQASQEGVAAQQRAETLRMQAMDLDATRKRREMVRQAVLARSQSLATASAQGAQFSSGLAGAQAGETSQTNYNLAGVYQNQEIGRGIFQANSDLLATKQRESKAQSQVALGQGISSLGGAIASGVGNINRVAGWGSAQIQGT